MKKGMKKLVALGMAAAMALATAITSFAAEPPATDPFAMKLFGQDLQTYWTGYYGKSYLGIVVGADRVTKEDITVIDEAAAHSAALFNLPESFNIPESDVDTVRRFANNEAGGFASNDPILDIYSKAMFVYNSLYFGDNLSDYSSEIYLVRVPAGTDLGDLSKYAIYASGAAQSTAKVGQWAHDDNGWWIQYSDGTYLVNDWYQDSESGNWYYMGADGYMVTNQEVPGGYSVDANGVRIQ
jgi:hypothetical protein